MRSPRRRTRLSLLARVFLANAAVLAVATLLLLFSPVEISYPVTQSQAILLVTAFLVSLIVNLVVLRGVIAPLRRLATVMRAVTPLEPGRRVAIPGADAEVAALTTAFNEMLDRLELERRDSARRALAAQEAERRRIARELHDEIGQVLTGLVLRSETLSRRAPDDLREDLEDLREAARHGAEEVRRIARRLRPEALDELGLQSALFALCTAVSERTGIEIARTFERDLPLSAEQELVIYRVAQESITNVVRHAGASHVDVTLRRDGDGGVLLVVRDDGVGLPPNAERDSAGLRGMRERALLVGGNMTITAAPTGGTEVRLHLPSNELA
jgi:two-component system, NarL family, sensor histidine kinase UhpB